MWCRVGRLNFTEVNFASGDAVLNAFYFVNNTFEDDDVGKPYVNLLFHHGTSVNIANNVRWER